MPFQEQLANSNLVDRPQGDADVEARGRHVRFTERVLAILRGGGLSDDLAVSASYLLTVVVNGFMLEEAPAEGHQPDADFLCAVSEYFASLPSIHRLTVGVGRRRAWMGGWW
jgi:Tetracyclin repressor-like, C-terminal domain